jgi:hypothetical protein
MKMTELQFAAPDVPAEWADIRDAHIAVATAIHAISGPGRSAEKIWAAPTREEWDGVCMAVENYVDAGVFAAEDDGRYAWGEAFVVLQRPHQEHIISAVLGEDAEVIEPC